jgi:NADH pyrophosphatase NudC (nudix superfamily)
MAEQRFIPKPGQVDYTHVRYAPVVNTVVTHEGKVLLVQRSPDIRLYPNYWNGISGFLDDSRSIEEKVTEELGEELGIQADDILLIQRGTVLLQEASDYNKTWLVVPVLARVKTADFKLDWEAARAKWYEPAEVVKLDLLPGFLGVFDQFLEVL